LQDYERDVSSMTAEATSACRNEVTRPGRLARPAETRRHLPMHTRRPGGAVGAGFGDPENPRRGGGDDQDAARHPHPRGQGPGPGVDPAQVADQDGPRTAALPATPPGWSDVARRVRSSASGPRGGCFCPGRPASSGGVLLDPTAACKRALAILARRIAVLSAEIGELDGDLEPLITATAPTLLAVFGVGSTSPASSSRPPATTLSGCAARPPSPIFAAWRPSPPHPERPLGTG
jgi:hypothetical protein